MGVGGVVGLLVVLYMLPFLKLDFESSVPELGLVQSHRMCVREGECACICVCIITYEQSRVDL